MKYRNDKDQKRAENFWANADRLRKAKGLQWQDIGPLVGTTGPNISTRKYARNMPELGFALDLAAILGTTVEELCLSPDSVDPAAITRMVSEITDKDDLEKISSYIFGILESKDGGKKS